MCSSDLCGRIDMVEGFDDFRSRQVCLQKLGGRGRFIIELGNVAVAFRIVIIRVDHDLARERLDGHRAVVLQRDRDHDDVSGLCRFDGSCRAGVGSELRDELRQALRPTGIADHDMVAVGDGKSRNLASDVSGTDKTDCCHDRIFTYSTGDLTEGHETSKPVANVPSARAEPDSGELARPKSLYFFGGLIMMCAPAVPGYISHGALSLALVDSPVDWGVANGT